MREFVIVSLLLASCVQASSAEGPCDVGSLGGVQMIASGSGNGGGGVGGAAPSQDPKPRVCVALSEGVYPLYYKICGETRGPIPFYCDQAPPAGSCQSLIADHGYPLQGMWCCCDPQRSDTCDFYR